MLSAFPVPQKLFCLHLPSLFSYTPLLTQYLLSEKGQSCSHDPGCTKSLNFQRSFPSVSSFPPRHSPLFRYRITAWLCLAFASGIPGKLFDVPSEVISGYSRHQLFYSTSAVFQFSCRGPLETANHHHSEPEARNRTRNSDFLPPETSNCAHHNSIPPSSTLGCEYGAIGFHNVARGHQVTVCTGMSSLFLLHKWDSTAAG